MQILVWNRLSFPLGGLGVEFLNKFEQKHVADLGGTLYYWLPKKMLGL